MVGRDSTETYIVVLPYRELKIAKIIFVFIISLNFYHSKKKPHANSPDQEKMLIYQALALQIRGAPIKKRGFVPIFFSSPSENDSCKARKYKL